jgi:hypothetical protein
MAGEGGLHMSVVPLEEGEKWQGREGIGCGNIAEGDGGGTIPQEESNREILLPSTFVMVVGTRQ